MKETLNRPIIIAGPCAAESLEQVMQSAEEAKNRGIAIMRMSLWKPRTEPGFAGVNGEGIPWLVEVAKSGVIPATEVSGPEQAEKIIDAIVKHTSSDVVLWLGARSQHHEMQQGVGHIVGKDFGTEIGEVVRGEDRVKLMIKNQMWSDERHWSGIVMHVVEGGASMDQLVLIHRGFAPGPNVQRNTPAFAMARQVKEVMKLPMIIDPSHIGGNVPRVIEIAQQALDPESGFDGIMIEVHSNPQEAQTDKGQQLTWDQFDRNIQNHIVFDARLAVAS